MPVDNPALHQGRTRSAPHVEGQWASYVFVPLRVNRRSTLGRLLRETLAKAKEITPTLHQIGNDIEGQGIPDDMELRISLTRPIYLRTHQREEFRIAVRTIAKNFHR